MTPLQLDPDQQAAVDHGEGPCLVLAGPGSGKTRVIVERFLRLCAAGIGAGEQLVLTYTRRAANEMRQRAELAHGPLPDEAPLTNYHSFAINVVRQWGWLLNISPAFHIADDAERWLHLEAVLAELRPRTLWNPLRPQDLIAPILEVIKTAKQELVTPERYTAWAMGRLEECGDAGERALLERHRECALVYAHLQERYRRHAVLDFEDAILYAEQLMREPAARQAVAGPIRHVMVDEYQDTDFAQSRLVDSLMAEHRNILVVADDDQSIYKFRGASRANLDRFETAHPDCQRLVLSRNYRSTTQVVEVARTIIAAAHPGSRIEKRLTAVRGDGEPVELWRGDTERGEMLAIARECRRLIDAGVRANDIAILFRRHVDMQPATQALQSACVPYQVQGGRGFFQQPEIKDVMALLTAADDPANSQSILRCLLLPSWKVTVRGRVALVLACHHHEQGLATLVEATGIEGLDDEDQRAARRCVEALLDLNARASRQDVREIFQAALEASDFLAILDLLSPLERMQSGANLNKFGELLETFADWSDDRRLATALRYLHALRSSHDADELAAIDPVEDGVVLLTAHAAKGLEWPVVFVPKCIETRWPGRGGSSSRLTLPDELVPEQAPTGDGVSDEERRLFYVAATRARDRLVFSQARRYPSSFRDRDEHGSPFLAGVEDGTGAAVRVNLPPAPAFSLGGTRPPRSALAARPSVSVSALRDFRACPRRYQYGHVYHMPTPQSSQGWYGLLIHTVLQTAATQRQTGIDVDEELIATLWSQAWDETPGEKGRNADLRSLGEEQLRRYIGSAAWRDAHITEVEQPFTLHMTSADIHGRLDRVDRRADGSPVIVDYKTGPPREAAGEARDLQVRAYAVAISQRERIESVTVELHRLQTTEVTRVPLGSRELDNAFKQLSAVTAELSDAMRSGAFPPRPSTWSCGHCDFRTVCDEGRQATGSE
ncbi:MAG: ATP-dependent helicase [Candidatus Dormibacteria bacterium]